MSEGKLAREEKTIEIMIHTYCRNLHHHDSGICDECNELLMYAKKRLGNCIQGTKKTTCGRCKVHCYKPEMRQKIKIVMRYSGPRFLLRHPLLLLIHFIDGLG